MIPKTSFKEFSKDFIEMTGDTIQRLIMARIVETPAYVIQELGLEFPPGRTILWGLLIFGKKSLHFFVHATESSLATMFRNATNGKPPRQQYLHIPRENLIQLEPVATEPGIFSLARILPFLRNKPRLLKVNFHFEEPHSQKKSPSDKGNYTIFLEPVVAMKEIIPLLEQYL